MSTDSSNVLVRQSMCSGLQANLDDVDDLLADFDHIAAVKKLDENDTWIAEGLSSLSTIWTGDNNLWTKAARSVPT